jgi:hypothetical protein
MKVVSGTVKFLVKPNVGMTLASAGTVLLANKVADDEMKESGEAKEATQWVFVTSLFLTALHGGGTAIRAWRKGNKVGATASGLLAATAAAAMSLPFLAEAATEPEAQG